MSRGSRARAWQSGEVRVFRSFFAKVPVVPNFFFFLVGKKNLSRIPVNHSLGHFFPFVSVNPVPVPSSLCSTLGPGGGTVLEGGRGTMGRPSRGGNQITFFNPEKLFCFLRSSFSLLK